MRKVYVTSMLALSLLFTSCLGSFSAWNNLKDWNEDATDSRFVNQVLFWAMNIVPVYPLFYLGDVVIFNTIEFWSGDNPIAMKAGDYDSQIVSKDGVDYKLEATQNEMKITVLSGEREGNVLKLIYEPADKSWNAVKDGETVKLTSYEDGFHIVYLPDGEEVRIHESTAKYEGLALLNTKIADYEKCLMAMSEESSETKL